EALVAKANFNLRKDALILIKRAYLKEKNKRAKKALFWILENAKIAKKENLAICQDTGFPLVFLEVGRDINISSKFIEKIKEGIIRGYKKNFLRASITIPFKNTTPFYGNGIIFVDFSSNTKGIKITIFPKGFGSESKTALKIFEPTVSFKRIEDFVVETVKEAGPDACPPFFVGIGIGGTSDYALNLAKKALLEPLNKFNSDKSIRILEKNLLKKLNSLKIGAFGFGGDSTVLAVKIKVSPTHIAGLPVGINLSCHALRSATLRIKNLNEFVY
ncbi:MAG: fumarate hydratase, partial [Candidatus Aenigmatarchaeota archaeon]